MVSSFQVLILVISLNVFTLTDEVASGCAPPLRTNGTLPFLEQIFKGRCYDYINLINGPTSKCRKNCTDLWDTFFTAFGYKRPCDVTLSDYDDFMKESLEPIGENRSLFWGGTRLIAHEFAANGRRLTTMEDTLVGYIANGLLWCGQRADPGINYHNCPAFDSCPDTERYSGAFWGSASTSFAQNAKGIVTVMLNGTRRNPTLPPFLETSFFGKYELPNMNKSKVSLVRVILVTDIDVSTKESCDGGKSLTTLKNQVTKKYGMKYECIDNPSEIQHLLCVDDPESRECRFITQYMKKQDKINWCLICLVGAIVEFTIAVSGAIVAGVFVTRRRRKARKCSPYVRDGFTDASTTN